MPDWKNELAKRVAGLKLEPTREAEILEELSQHLDDRYQELVALGNSPQEAERIALNEISRHGLLVRQLRQVEQQIHSEPVPAGARGAKNLFTALWQDLRYAARLLRLSPAFTIIALSSLALGIGANTAIFQLLDAVRIRSLPVTSPQELAEVTIPNAEGERRGSMQLYGQMTNALWERLRADQQAFSGIFAWGKGSLNLANGGEARYAKTMYLSGGAFGVLGVRPLLGRTFTEADDRKGCGAPGVVISHAFWQREYGGDARVIGKTISLNSHPIEIRGVTPANFFGLEIGQGYDVALPLCAEPTVLGEESRLADGTGWWLVVIGRLKPGWSLERATAQLNAISEGIFKSTVPPNYPTESVPSYLKFKLAASPAGAGVSKLRDDYTTPLYLLLGTAGLVLLIACANLANLMLARASAREKEIAVRLALGASRARLLGQLLTESLLLAAVGSLLGLLLSRGLSGFLVSFLDTTGDATFLDLSPDWRVLGFTAGLTLLTCLLFGLTPALRAANANPGTVMKSGGRGVTSSRERFGLRRALVVSQVSLSLVLLVSALLFSRSLRNLLNLDAGFARNGVLIAALDFTHLNLPAERRQSYKDELLGRLRAIPGVDSAATVGTIPLGGGSWSNNVWIDGTDSQQQKNSMFNSVSEDYFKTMQTPLLAGREFDRHDTAASTRVAVVNQAFADRFTNGASPVGKRFWRQRTPRAPETMYEIVGLVRNTKYMDLREDFHPIAFTPESQALRQDASIQVMLRSRLLLGDLMSSVKRTVAQTSPEIVIEFDSLNNIVEGSLLRERLMATLSGFFGLLAAALAIIGLYGVMSYMVARRTNEIGIRMALGADRANVLALVLREAGQLLAFGLAVGTALAVAAGFAARAMLCGLTPYDPLTLAMAMAGLAAVALTASYLPAQRAAKLDPMVALREE
jgi:putative ABC transport system permease protein